METAGGQPPTLPPITDPPHDHQSFPPNMDLHPAAVSPPTQPLAAEQVPPPPPPADVPTNTTSAPENHSGSEDGSGSEQDDSEDEDGEPRAHWQPIQEDTSLPCEDELKYIDTKDEHSALDHAYWEKQAFFDLEDPEYAPVDTGRIDFLVEHYNGTKENPNTELVMRSPIVRVGGLDWRIKFYPKGHEGDYLSCYLECVSARSPEFPEFEEFDSLPFPNLKDTKPIQKRHTVAVQLGIVMYNPAEPRVNEFKSEATQYSKASPDFGWKYFSQQARYEFHYRQHGQRQAILRDDKLAFSAYIRVVQDPTSCLWRQDNRNKPNEYIATTGLRPFTKSIQYVSALTTLMHFPAFRGFVRHLQPGNQLALLLQPLLLKMYTRKLSASYDGTCTFPEGDVSEIHFSMAASVRNTYHDNPKYLAQFREMLGTFHFNMGSAIGPNRLNTKQYPSVQAAVNNHPKSIERPALLTLELQRHEHDKKTRKWVKISNKVKVEEQINVEGTSYTLFAFITHLGHVQSSRYNSYVRPKGPGKGWYAYQDGKVTRLTEQQARDRHSGPESDDERLKTPENGYDSPYSEFHPPMTEVTSSVMYVRDDMADATFNAPDEEAWVVTTRHAADTLNATYENPPHTAAHDHVPKGDGPVTNAYEWRHGENGETPMSEEEYIRILKFREAIEEAAGRATPEPVLRDGEDIVMKNSSDTSAYIEPEVPDPAPLLEYYNDVCTFDWLGRQFYEGKWKNGKFHGGGHLIAPNGDEYLGEFVDGQREGYGRMTYALTGDVYDGKWKANEPDGLGRLTEAGSGNVYDGTFKEGRKTGEFTLKGTVTEEDKSTCDICYEKEMDTAFYDCGHVVACRGCAVKVDTCPVCRRRVVARLQLYGVRVSKT